MSPLAMPALGWLAGAAIWFWWLRRYDRFEPEPLASLLIVGLVGGAVSGAASGLAEALFMKVTGIVSPAPRPEDGPAMAPVAGALLAMFVGFSEEALKAVSAVTLTRRFGDLDEPVDATLYAMITALGFAVLENLLYASRFGSSVLLLRYLLSTPVHVVLALVWGNAWAKGRFLLPHRPLWRVMAPAVLSASVLHGAWDYVAFVRSAQGTLLAFFTLVMMLVWAHGTKQAIAMESPFVPLGHCPQCGGVGERTARFCRHCGRTMSGAYFVRCESCNGRLPAYANFCPGCGEGRAAG